MVTTAPTASFTIPSTYDDTNLECRIYHPPTFSNHGVSGDTKWRKKGAVIAHAYAPLGGSLDDPIVHSAAEEVLKQGFVVGLFNFRGAGASKGRTSWTAKPERQDYISFVGFLFHYLQELNPTVSAVTSSPVSPMNHSLSPIPSSTVPTAMPETTLLLSGYSYGSLIATSLPPIEAILPIFTDAVKGSAQAEIRLRATHLSQQWNAETQQARRRGRTLVVESPRADGTIKYGGEECEPGTRRRSRESMRSLDVVRRSMDRSRVRLSPRKRSNGELSRSSASEEYLPLIEAPIPYTMYLLISPLLPPVSRFVTMFTKKWPSLSPSSSILGDPDSSTTEAKLRAHPSLAIYGSKDMFTSQRKLRKWTEHLVSQPGSHFTFSEVTGAGHFWNEQGSESRMKTSIREWLKGVEGKQKWDMID